MPHYHDPKWKIIFHSKLVSLHLLFRQNSLKWLLTPLFLSHSMSNPLGKHDDVGETSEISGVMSWTRWQETWFLMQVEWLASDRSKDNSFIAMGRKGEKTWQKKSRLMDFVVGRYGSFFLTVAYQGKSSGSDHGMDISWKKIMNPTKSIFVCFWFLPSTTGTSKQCQIYI